ncbi:MAG: chemotaxis protein CheD [Dehalococcoidia bacterium]
MTIAADPTQRVHVGIGALALSKDKNTVLVAYGLGSCIGISVFDPAAGVGGMVHVLLPSSDGKAPDPREPARFADIGVPALVARCLEQGALKARLVVKIAGGASVLGASNGEKFKIGARNAEAVKEHLKAQGLRLSVEDLGGTKGRTLELHIAGGKTFVRTATSQAVEI